MPQPVAPLDSPTIAKRGIAKPLSSPGGKEAWRDILKARVPDHRVYVEPYAGSATLFFAKAERSEVEVLADTDADIVAVYMFLRDGSDADFAWMRKQDFTPSSTRFTELKSSKPRGRRQRVYRTKYLNLHSRRGAGDKFNSSTKGTGVYFKRDLEKFRDRLEGVKIFHADALEVIKQFDGDDTFFYLDPPWKAEGIGDHWTAFDGSAFATAAKSLVGKTLISYQGDIDLGEDWRQVTISSALGGIGKRSTQHLLINYEPPVLKFGGQSGAHSHMLDRPGKKTREDGIHQHLFEMPDGSLLTTEYDGQHDHNLAKDDADVTGPEKTKHTHALIPLEGEALVTGSGSEHTHETQIAWTVEGGLHTHTVEVDGERLKSLSPGEFWAKFTVRNARAAEERFFKAAGTTAVDEPFANEHVAKQTRSERYSTLTRKASDFAGIYLVMGEADGRSEVQAVHFDARTHTPAHAREWLETHKFAISGLVEASKALEHYPEKRGPHDARAHLHFEGESNTLAFRFKFDDRALGWTLAVQRPGILTSQAKAIQHADVYSITGSRLYRPILDAEVIAAKGAVGSGSAARLAEGTVEYGLQDENDREYFLHGAGALSGILRLKARYSASGECGWVASLSKSTLPRVLTSEAVEAGIMPPDGISGLPESLEKVIPAEFRYWSADGNQAREVRDALVAKGLIADIVIFAGEIRAALVKRFVAPYPAPAIIKSLATMEPPIRRAMALVQKGASQPLLIAPHVAEELGTDDLVRKLVAADQDYLVAWPDSCHARTVFAEIGRPFVFKHGGGNLVCVSSRPLIDIRDIEFVDSPLSLELFTGMDPASVPMAMRKIARLYDDVIKRTIPIVQVGKKDAPDEQYALGIVLVPETVDAQKDIYSSPEIRKAAHGWMEFHRNRGLMHKEIVNDRIVVLESYTALVDMEVPISIIKAKGKGKGDKVPTKLIKAGTWLMGYGIRDADLWKDVKSGKLTGLSIGGTAERRPRED